MAKVTSICACMQSPETVSAREFEVASLATLQNSQIAALLHISHETVKAHMASVARKVGVEGRAAVAVWADRISMPTMRREVCLMERVVSISAGVRTCTLERAVIRLASDRYPLRLTVIHRELERRKFKRAA